jgi:hypothetical protein
MYIKFTSVSAVFGARQIKSPFQLYLGRELLALFYKLLRTADTVLMSRLFAFRCQWLYKPKCAPVLRFY